MGGRTRGADFILTRFQQLLAFLCCLISLLLVLVDIPTQITAFYGFTLGFAHTDTHTHRHTPLPPLLLLELECR